MGQDQHNDPRRDHIHDFKPRKKLSPSTSLCQKRVNSYRLLAGLTTSCKLVHANAKPASRTILFVSSVAPPFGYAKPSTCLFSNASRSRLLETISSLCRPSGSCGNIG